MAHKTNRRYIGVEMGDHAYTLCKPRLDSIISGMDRVVSLKALSGMVAVAIVSLNWLHH